VVEDIITALSRIGWLFVIARNSSYTYKGQLVNVKQVGRELGVRYVLEGSLRKAVKRVRITGSSSTRRPVGISGQTVLRAPLAISSSCRIR
jgi:TolB-like protein